MPIKIPNSLPAREILEAVEALRQAEVWCNANVGAGAICGALAVKL